ncbi:MAG TPA: hypothetical protein VN446_01115 [Candidatus Acidoferrum sp.]|nr:hypothetical protein [Candidatus Acidoferrum sp.]
MQTKILLWFDVEDYVTPQADDAFKEVLDMLGTLGIRATVKFVTKKLETLQVRGRTDILRLLPNHEMAFHSTLHSVHPMPSEYLNGYEFAAGAAEFDRREYPGFLKVSELTGQHQTSYGQASYAWAPQVFPAMRKWGVTTYLDAHQIINMDEMPFWYGGVLCLTRMKDNIIRLQHRDGALPQYIAGYEARDRRGDISFVSTYDHPTEYCTQLLWDRPFAHGVNPRVLNPAPLRAEGEQSKYIGMLRDFILYTLRDGAEYITVSQAAGYEKRRVRPITAEDLREYAAGFDGKVSYAEVAGEWLSASEVFSLCARALTGRALTPELLWGPEEDTPSVFHTETVPVTELAQAAYAQHDLVLGYKQLKTLYRVGDNFINPLDMQATMLRALREGGETVALTRAMELAAAAHVDDSFKFTSSVLFEGNFKGEEIFRQTRLQCWTLKPTRF